MKKLASAVFVVIGATALLFAPACGGDDDPDPVVDTAGDGDGDDDGDTTGDGDGDGDVACNAVEQTGCADGEKCAFVLVDPESGAGFTGCVADGTLEFGEACEGPSEADSADGCKAGLSCVFGACTIICGSSADCAAANDGLCAPFEDTDFDMCLPGCDLIDQDCAGDEGTVGCYFAGGGGVCAGVAAEVEVGGECQAANGCLPGAGCFGPQGGPSICRDFCGPWPDGQVDTDGDDVLDNFSECGDIIGCADLDSVCLELTDANNMPLGDRIAICIPDDELVNPPAVCSCQDRPGPEGSVCDFGDGTFAPVSTPKPRFVETLRRL